MSAENFTNETIAIDLLPKHETILLQKPHPDYWKIICINLTISLLLAGVIVGLAIVFVDQVKPYTWPIILGYLFFWSLMFLLFRTSFKKRGYALRTKDLVAKKGLIAESTTIVPLNRIQHIELNEGIFSRLFKLASLQIFTAGGHSGHLRLSGIPIDDAKNIRDLILNKLELVSGRKQGTESTIS